VPGGLVMTTTTTTTTPGKEEEGGKGLAPWAQEGRRPWGVVSIPQGGWKALYVS